MQICLKYIMYNLSHVYILFRFYSEIDTGGRARAMAPLENYKHYINGATHAICARGTSFDPQTFKFFVVAIVIKGKTHLPPLLGSVWYRVIHLNF